MQILNAQVCATLMGWAKGLRRERIEGAKCQDRSDQKAIAAVFSDWYPAALRRKRLWSSLCNCRSRAAPLGCAVAEAAVLPPWAGAFCHQGESVQCARAFWSGRGESEPVNMTGVPGLTHCAVWHGHVHMNVTQVWDCVCVYVSAVFLLSLPTLPALPFLSSR